MRLRFVSVPAAVALLCAAGCSVITSYDGFSGGESMAPDATVKDSGPPVTVVDSAASLTEQTLCGPNIPPPPGETAESPVTSYAGVVTALRFNPADGGCPQLGKNLDGIDSCDGGAACLTNNGTGSTCVTDYAGGVDNAGAGALGTLLFGNSSLANLPDDIAAQRTGFVLTLSNYSGEADNSTVNVGFLSDVGIGPDGGTLVDQNAVTGLASHVVIQTPGYVTHGVLVAHFGPTTPMSLHFTTILPDSGPYPGVHGALLTITDGYIIGHPVIADGGISMLDAQLVGRIKGSDLVNALTAVYACVNASSAPQFCGFLDLPINRSDDGTTVGYCEAISFAIGFDLAPTFIAGTAPATAPVNLCGADEPVPISDTVCEPSAPPPPPDGGDGGGDAGDDSGL